MSWIKELYTKLVDLFVGVFKQKSKVPTTIEEYKVRHFLQENKPKTIKRIIIEAERNELLLMKKLSETNNQPATTRINLKSLNRTIKHRGIKRCLYLLDNNDVYYARERHLVCVDNKLFKSFKRKFKRYGLPRIPKDKKG